MNTNSYLLKGLNFETKMSENIFTVVMLGKTGNGKSATGNTLLELYRFEEGCNMTSETHSLVNYTMKPKDYTWTLKVFDTPGLADTEDDNPYTNLKAYAENMNKLMDLCRKGNHSITAFLLVFNITSRFTQEDRKTIDAYKAIFGEEFLGKHCIIVFTFGDIFDLQMEDWARNRAGELKQLLTKCENRIVLVCNRDRDDKRKESRKRIVSAIESLRRKYQKSYGYDDYMKQEPFRYKTLLKYELDRELDREYTERIREIKQNIEKLSKRNRRDKIVILKNEIQKIDNGTKLLQKYIYDLERELMKIDSFWYGLFHW